MELVKTGVKVTDEEAAPVRELANHARKTPVILMGGHNMSAEAWQRANKACHELALSKGLPEIRGYYGLDEENEFVKTKEYYDG